MHKKIIILTGGAGFIGANLLQSLNDRGEDNIVVVDSLHNSQKWKNLSGKIFYDYLDKTLFIDSIRNNKFNGSLIKAIFHLGACSKTTEQNADYLIENNTIYTRDLALFSIKNNIPFYYASSAATYGSGEKGYEDNENKIYELRPKNMYGYSKQLFDLWAYKNKWFDKITGFKFFNVFGPYEYHKIGMTSIVYDAYKQILSEGKVKLFKSDLFEYKDGEQVRDFIYVKDVVNVILWFYDNPSYHGLYNLGRGERNTWKFMVESVFKALNKEPKIEYIDMPSILKGKYQYHTLADMSKTIRVCPLKFSSLESSINEYVNDYLIKEY